MLIFRLRFTFSKLKAANITSDTKLKLSKNLRSNTKSFSYVIVDFGPIWENKPNKKKLTKEIIDTMPTDKIHLNFDCIDGSN